MYDKETLSRVSEYKPGRAVARPAAASTAGGLNVETTDPGHGRTPDAEGMREKSRVPSDATLDQAVGSLSAHVQNLHRSLQFSIDKGSGETVVRVVDSETKEVIRQIPSEEVLAIAERLRSASGVLVSETV